VVIYILFSGKHPKKEAVLSPNVNRLHCVVLVFFLGLGGYRQMRAAKQEALEQLDRSLGQANNPFT
jgi:hypothetical protein